MRRNSIQIAAAILDIVIKSPVPKTKLLTRTNLNTSGFNKYITLLTKKGLLTREGKLYCITDKGRATYFTIKEFQHNIEALT